MQIYSIVYSAEAIHRIITQNTITNSKLYLHLTVEPVSAVTWDKRLSCVTRPVGEVQNKFVFVCV